MNPGEGTPVLVTRAGGRYAAFPMSLVRETMRPMTCQQVAGFATWMLGIAIVRGVPAPVVDLGALMSGASSRAISRFISLRSAEGVFVAAVDEVIGLRSFDAATLSLMPPLLSAAGGGAIAGLGAIGHELMVLFDAGRLVPPEAWQAMPGTEALS